MMLYITRHGQPLSKEGQAIDNPDYPPGDPPLSDLGREQARRLGRRLKQEGFAGRIYASPYRRTIETAHVIAGELDLFVWPEPAIREFTGPNIVTFRGATLEELRRRFPRIAPAAELPYPWWTLEPELPDEHRQRPAIDARVGAFLQSMLSEHGEDLLMVAHGASCHSAIRHCQQLIQGAFPDNPPVAGWNCALTALRFQAPVAFTLLGDTAHLEDDQVTSNSRTKQEVLAERALQ